MNRNVLVALGLGLVSGVVILSFAIRDGSFSNGSGDRRAGEASSKVERTRSERQSPSQQPKPEKTYVRSVGDPKTHEFRITILDKGLAYDTSTCSALTAYGFLVFSGPNRNYENLEVHEPFPIPAQAEAASDGTCATTMTVTIPYRPRYSAGLGREGKGIRNPEDPDSTEIVTHGNSQDVTNVNYRQD